MNPLRELRALVSSSTVVESGVVTRTTASGLVVRTRGGLKSFSIPNAEAYKTGDTVRFQGNVLLGKSISIENIPVFKV